MAKGQSKSKTEAPKEIEVPEVEPKEVEAPKVEKVSETKPPEVKIEKVDKVATNNVKGKVIQDIPNLFIWGKRYAHRKGETIVAPEEHVNKLRETGYVQ